MSSTITPATPAPTQSRLVPENSINVLNGVTWQEYLRYRDDPANQGVRMYFSDGSLLLMTTGRLHERIKSVLATLLQVWAEQNDQTIMCCGQWTLQKALAEKGLEADNCYYVSNTLLVRGRHELDLETDPPPDLAIEVDITTRSEHKFEIYAALGVAEIWVWQGDSIQCFRLTDGSFELIAASLELPGFPFAAAVDVIKEFVWEDDVAAAREFRRRVS